MVVETEMRERFNGVQNIMSVCVVLEVVGILCLSLYQQMRERPEFWTSRTKALGFVVTENHE